MKHIKHFICFIRIQYILARNSLRVAVILLKIIGRFRIKNPLNWFRKTQVIHDTKIYNVVDELKPALKQISQTLLDKPEVLHNTLSIFIKKLDSHISSNTEQRTITIIEQDDHCVLNSKLKKEQLEQMTTADQENTNRLGKQFKKSINTDELS